MLSLVGATVASTLIQGNWRWRNDDGDENTATFKANENTPITINNYDVIRLRVRIENSSADAGENHRVGGLRYSTSPNGTFEDVKNDGTGAFKYVQSPNAPSHKSPTTNTGFLTATNPGNLSPYNFINGQYFSEEIGGLDEANKSLVAPSTYSDLEFVIQPTSNILPNTTYYFLIQNEKEGGAHNLAQLTTASTLPVTLISFEALTKGNHIALSWNTASEHSSDKFEVLRSEDGENWIFLTSVKAKGNSTLPERYSYLDINPLNGTSYYKLVQYDFDGTATVLATRAVSSKILAGLQLTVFPNPATSELNLDLQNYAGKRFSVQLYDQLGKLIQSESFENNGQSKFNLNSSIKPGTYILKVVGENLSLSKKVTIL